MMRIANAPCSWGALEFDLDGTAPGFARVLDEIQETGYAGSELGDWGFMPTDPHDLESEIRKEGTEHPRCICARAPEGPGQAQGGH